MGQVFNPAIFRLALERETICSRPKPLAESIDFSLFKGGECQMASSRFCDQTSFSFSPAGNKTTIARTLRRVFIVPVPFFNYLTALAAVWLSDRARVR